MITWKDIDNAQRTKLLKRYLDGVPAEVLADETGMREITLRRRLQEWRYIVEEKKHRAKGSSPKGEFEKHWKLFCKLIGRDPTRPIPKTKVAVEKDSRKVVVLCDIHGKPYMPIQEAIRNEQPDIIVYDGDIFDAYAYSKYAQKMVLPIEDELAHIRAMLEYNSQFCPRQLLTRGNHEDRAFKYFTARVDTEFLPLIKWNLLELAAEGIGGVEVVENRFRYLLPGGEAIEDAFENCWIIILGDAIAGHANVARKGDTRSVAIFMEWVDKWRLQLGMPDPSLLIQAHVHGAGISYGKGGHQILIEGGFAGNLHALDYSMDYGHVGWRPTVFGYTTFIQKQVKKEWKTDLPSVRFNLV